MRGEGGEGEERRRRNMRREERRRNKRGRRRNERGKKEDTSGRWKGKEVRDRFRHNKTSDDSHKACRPC